MTLTVALKGGLRFDIASGKHTVITDQPVDDGGTDAGMSPVELFIGSLAGCVGYFVATYCARHGIVSEGLVIEANWTMAEQPHRVGGVELRLNLPGTLTPDQQERLFKVAHGCTVHQTLALPPKIEIHLSTRHSS
ncbi:MAG: OsmC family protein [Nitrospirae bacterium]|nr:OsmC family protein [Nitrospirota bacterium]